MGLQEISCPTCGNFLFPRNESIKPASSYKDCLRRCDSCLVGFSNAKVNPTIIYESFSQNIPLQLREDLDLVLSNSLNCINRVNKKNKFAFSTSEDALTWSFFKYFAVKNKLVDLLELLNIDSVESNYEIYLWGTNICSRNNDSNFREKLIETSKLFNESRNRITEPDVILKLKNELVFIEVKYLSKNEIINKLDKFDKYKIPSIDIEKVKESGHYELYRNWAFVSKLSYGVKFKLLNLGLQKLFTDRNKSKLQLFENSINSDNGCFLKISWEQIFNKMTKYKYDEWFLNYLEQKIRPVKASKKSSEIKITS